METMGHSRCERHTAPQGRASHGMARRRTAKRAHHPWSRRTRARRSLPASSRRGRCSARLGTASPESFVPLPPSSDLPHSLLPPWAPEQCGHPPSRSRIPPRHWTSERTHAFFFLNAPQRTKSRMCLPPDSGGLFRLLPRFLRFRGETNLRFGPFRQKKKNGYKKARGIQCDI